MKKALIISLLLIGLFVFFFSVGNYFSFSKAIVDNDIARVKLLLRFGVDFNRQGRLTSWTPLHYAAANGNKEIADLLISKGAKLDIKDNNNYAPLDYAMTANRKEVAKLLIEKGAQVTDHMLNSAAFNGNNEVVEILLNKGLNVNAPCDRCPSPFHSAMYKDHDEVVELMIKHGALVNPKEKHSYAPLHVAASSHAEKTVRLLISKGAKINATDEKGHTPLYYATEKEDITIQQILISAGAERR